MSVGASRALNSTVPQPTDSFTATLAWLGATIGALLLGGAINTLLNITLLWTLAGEGVVFLEAHTQVPITLVSHTSMLTGALPHQHGVRDNGGYALVCNHNTGHGYPENVQGEFRRADTYNFLLDHPWGVNPHPYEVSGVPDWVPNYCSDQ